jgi:hypothetical protein
LLLARTMQKTIFEIEEPSCSEVFWYDTRNKDIKERIGEKVRWARLVNEII